MNFYEARELRDKNDKGTGVWHYTCYNDNQKATYPVGYCAKWKEPVLREDGGIWGKEEAEKYTANKDKYHNETGHKTSRESCECYKQYQLDNNLRFWKKNLKDADTHHKCEIKGCDKMTASYASVGMPRWSLCDEHLNIEEVKKLFNVGSSFGS